MARPPRGGVDARGEARRGARRVSGKATSDVDLIKKRRDDPSDATPEVIRGFRRWNRSVFQHHRSEFRPSLVSKRPDRYERWLQC